jgi:hypothetical protein
MIALTLFLFLTLSGPLMMRETVAVETPASFAIFRSL